MSGEFLTRVVTPKALVKRAGGPRAEHYRALADGLEKFMSKGKWSMLCGGQTLPAFAVRWDDVDLPRDKAAAVCRYTDGSLLLCLRSDIDAAFLHRCVIHECQHLHDIDLIHAGAMTHTIAEWRASATEARLGLVP